MARQKQKLTAVQKILRRAKTRKVNLQKKLEILTADFNNEAELLKNQVIEQQDIISALEKKT
jgi:hypothetical protein